MKSSCLEEFVFGNCRYMQILNFAVKKQSKVSIRAILIRVISTCTSTIHTVISKLQTDRVLKYATFLTELRLIADRGYTCRRKIEPIIVKYSISRNSLCFYYKRFRFILDIHLQKNIFKSSYNTMSIFLFAVYFTRLLYRYIY